jgi:hypothetical protein
MNYIKPAFYGNEPRDVYQYWRTNPAFPHESTADQFFPSRTLKATACWARTRWKNCAPTPLKNFRDFIREILKGHLKMGAPDWPAPLLQGMTSS